MAVEPVDLTVFPPHSICAEMVIDIFADRRNGEITILHDRPFSSAIKTLVFDPVSSRLSFVMGDGAERDFGVAIAAGLSGLLATAREAAFFEVDRATNARVGDGFIVPVRIRA